MKKILISVIFVLLIICLYFTCANGIKIANLKVESLGSIKKMDEQLNNKKLEANEKNLKEYPASLSKLKEAINSLNIEKDKYNEKVKYLGGDVAVNTLQVEKYKIEFLWTKLGNYADKHQIKMQMDVIAAGENMYDLSFNIVGSYIDVTDFIYEIEKDSELNFRISEFKLIPDSTTTTTSIVTENNTETKVEEPYSGSMSVSTSEGPNAAKALEGSSTTTTQPTTENPDAENGGTNQNAETATQQPTTSQSSGTKTIYSPRRLEASFKVYGVEINFD